MKDWWPSSLAHIPKETPWADDDVIVAEVKSFDEVPSGGHRVTFAALVPLDQIGRVEKELDKLKHDVSTSGPHPFYSKDRPFTPKFWIGTKTLPREQYEPLVLSWRSHDKTVLQPDPGFLMTYGLVPRALIGGTVNWDDPQTPRHNIVSVTAPSVWEFPLSSHAYVSISKDYLQDYLTLRQMVLVQVYWEIRWSEIDPEIAERLKDDEGINIDFPNRRLQLGRRVGDRGIVFAQVWGARVVATPGALPITADPLDDEGLAWPGFDKPITNSVASGLGVVDCVYIDDAVLGAYEGHQEFRVHPESGSVSYGTQWSVGFCDRVGRNLIRLELKKLYEGSRAEVIRHWHKFAVMPLSANALFAARHERNIATRAERVTYATVSLGEALSKLAGTFGLEILPEEFVGLRRRALDYNGWWTFEVTEPTARHVPLALTADSFLDRCMNLEKLAIEGLREGNLRRILLAMHAPAEDIADFRSLKLLDRIVCLAQVADAAGLSLKNYGPQLWARLTKEGTTPVKPIEHLFALHDVRILKAHKASDRGKRLQDELERFDIRAGEEAAGYGKILDKIYDVLSSELDDASAKIESAA
jgi:hypothetical protein